MPEGLDHVAAISGVNADGDPFIHLVVTHRGTEVVVQLDPEEAREVALHILEAAEASQSDALFVHFFRAKLELGPERAAAILLDFRKLREELGGVKVRGRDDEHWQKMAARQKEPSDGN